ncbi:hypothetical protein [Clostridioides sp. ZZV14-6044]|uniref:hypothetical protein n=1 Tax=Clostridioides sp. ZZV14-6044 TaxID=2811488 RepID=UPI0039B9C3C2
MKIKTVMLVNTALQGVFGKYQKALLVAHCKFIYFLYLKVLKMLNLFWPFILTKWYVKRWLLEEEKEK